MSSGVIMLLLCAGLLAIVGFLATVGLWCMFRKEYNKKENYNESVDKDNG